MRDGRDGSDHARQTRAEGSWSWRRRPAAATPSFRSEIVHIVPSNVSNASARQSDGLRRPHAERDLVREMAAGAQVHDVAEARVGVRCEVHDAVARRLGRQRRVLHAAGEVRHGRGGVPSENGSERTSVPGSRGMPMNTSALASTAADPAQAAPADRCAGAGVRGRAAPDRDGLDRHGGPWPARQEEPPRRRAPPTGPGTARTSTTARARRPPPSGSRSRPSRTTGHGDAARRTRGGPGPTGTTTRAAPAPGRPTRRAARSAGTPRTRRAAPPRATPSS